MEFIILVEMLEILTINESRRLKSEKKKKQFLANA